MTRRGITLVLVLVCLTLAAAIIMPLAAISGSFAVTSGYRCDALPHRLAGDSLVALLPEWLERSRDLRDQLDRSNRATLHLKVGDVRVDAVLQDDSAKLPVAALLDPRRPERLRAALERAMSESSIPVLTVASDIRVAVCLDELFEDATDAELFAGLESRGVSDVASTIGQRVNIRRANANILEATLADLQPGAGTDLARLATLHPKEGSEALLNRIEISAAARREALTRLATETERYSLRIRTSRGADVRWRYVICDTAESATIIADWEIAP